MSLFPVNVAGIDCYMPANGETVTVKTNPSVPVDISLNLLKREMALGGKLSLKFRNVMLYLQSEKLPTDPGVVCLRCSEPMQFL